MPKLDCIQIDPKSPITHSVIWLHGLGAHGRDFAKLVPKLTLPKNHGIRFIFPTAPERPITMRGGKVATAWYDLIAIHPKRKINMGEFDASVTMIHDLIEQEIEQGVPSENIFVIGFSQGGAVTYEAALLFNKPLAGLLSLSTYLPRNLDIHESNQSLPIYIFHGENDSMVPYDRGETAYEDLMAKGANVELITMPIRHEVSRAQLAQMSAILKGEQ